MSERERFEDEMRKTIADTITEAIKMGFDPREYHPFYLRIYKYILIGQRKSFINEEDVWGIWFEFDELAKTSEVSTCTKSTAGNVELSPYALYIRDKKVYVNGQQVEIQRNETEVLKHLKRLEGVAKKMWQKWKRNDIISDLNKRLQFFEECKTMTFPADVVTMNNLWNTFLYGPIKETKAKRKAREDSVEEAFLETRRGRRKRAKAANVEERAVWKRETRSSRRINAESKEKVKKFSSRNCPNRIQLCVTIKRAKKRDTVKKRKQQMKMWKVFMSNQSRKRWCLRMICRRRRKYEYERMRRLNKMEKIMERIIITGQCNLHTLRNRRKIMKSGLDVGHSNTAVKKTKGKKTSMGNNSKTNYECPFCDKVFSKSKFRKGHIISRHPEEYKKSQLEKRRETYKKANLLKRAQWKRFRETGEGPSWLAKKTAKFGSTNPSRHMCDECGETFCSVTNVRKHKLRVHDSNRPISKCPLCPEERFIDGTYLWFHFLKEHLNHDIMKISKLKGQSMGYVYKDPEIRNFKTERVQVEGCLEHICDECGQIYETSGSLARHQKVTHYEPEIWNCEICNRPFKTRDARDAHVRQIHEGLDFKCDICNRKLQSKGKLWRHKVEHHGMAGLEPPEGLVILACHYCGQSFLRGMPAHVKKCHPEKWEEFLEIQKAEKKLKRTINPKPVKKYKKTFTEESRLKGTLRKRELRRKWREEGIAEVRWVMERPPKICYICKADVKKLVGSWSKHLKDEHGVELDTKKWVCPMDCSKVFYTSRELKKHAMGHVQFGKRLKDEGHFEEKEVDGHTEFYCLKCQSIPTVKMCSVAEVMVHFALSHNEIYQQLKDSTDPQPNEINEINFQDIHLVPEPIYKCQICFAEFFSDSDLRSHFEVTHSFDCWRCPEPNCGKVILNPQELEEHFMSMHSEYPVEDVKEVKVETQSEKKSKRKYTKRKI